MLLRSALPTWKFICLRLLRSSWEIWNSSSPPSSTNLQRQSPNNIPLLKLLLHKQLHHQLLRRHRALERKLMALARSHRALEAKGYPERRPQHLRVQRLPRYFMRLRRPEYLMVVVVVEMTVVVTMEMVMMRISTQRRARRRKLRKMIKLIRNPRQLPLLRKLDSKLRHLEGQRPKPRNRPRLMSTRLNQALSNLEFSPQG